MTWSILDRRNQAGGPARSRETTSSSAFLLHGICAATAFVLLHCNTPSFVPFLLVPVDLYPGSQPQSLVQGTVPESAFRTTWTDVSAASVSIPQHITKL
jgi:hypothetical protein